MTSPIVVSNASPLIALHRVGRLDLMRALFATVLIPPSVAREIAPSLPTRPDWLVERPLAHAIDARLLRTSLDVGERDTIGLALELSAT